MNRISYLTGLLLLLIAGAVLPGCTRNNGDIGKWFGTWHLTEITVDGVPDSGYEGNIFWKFQSDIICMVRVDYGEGMNRYEQVWGTWEETDSSLLLDFSYSDELNPPESGESGKGIYAPFPVTRIPYGTVAHMEIVSDSSKALTLRYVDTGGKVCGYVLRKQ